MVFVMRDQPIRKYSFIGPHITTWQENSDSCNHQKQWIILSNIEEYDSDEEDDDKTYIVYGIVLYCKIALSCFWADLQVFSTEAHKTYP